MKAYIDNYNKVIEIVPNKKEHKFYIYHDISIIRNVKYKINNNAITITGKKVKRKFLLDLINYIIYKNTFNSLEELNNYINKFEIEKSDYKIKEKKKIFSRKKYYLLEIDKKLGFMFYKQKEEFKRIFLNYKVVIIKQ